MPETFEYQRERKSFGKIGIFAAHFTKSRLFSSWIINWFCWGHLNNVRRHYLPIIGNLQNGLKRQAFHLLLFNPRAKQIDFSRCLPFYRGQKWSISDLSWEKQIECLVLWLFETASSTYSNVKHHITWIALMDEANCWAKILILNDFLRSNGPDLPNLIFPNYTNTYWAKWTKQLSFEEIQLRIMDLHVAPAKKIHKFFLSFNTQTFGGKHLTKGYGDFASYRKWILMWYSHHQSALVISPEGIFIFGLNINKELRWSRHNLQKESRKLSERIQIQLSQYRTKGRIKMKNNFFTLSYRKGRNISRRK